MTKNQKTRALLVCGAVGGPLFILVFLVEGFTRTQYDPLRHPVSSLSLGAYGWMQVANFLLLGLLLIAFAIGMRRALRETLGSIMGPLMVGFAGLGLLGAGIFVTDPVFGYPTDEPLLLSPFTVHGYFHNIFAILLFLGLPIACFVFHSWFARLHKRGWAMYSALSGIGMLLSILVAVIGFSQFPLLVAYGGLFQRLSISIGCIWASMIAVHLLRAHAPHSKRKIATLGG